MKIKQKYSLKYHRFTLIELLAVMAIASLLVGLMLPAFNRMLAGNKVDDMAVRLKLGLELAQATAASKNRYVALVLPNGSDSTITDEEVQQHRLGGYRMAYVAKSGNNWNFENWVEGSDWRNAPAGAVLAMALDGSQNSRQTLPNKGAGDDYEVDSKADDGKLITGCATDRKADLPTSSTDPLLGLNTQPSNTDGGNVGSNSLVVFSPRGGIMNGTDIYLVVAGAEFSGSSIVYPENNGSTGSTYNYRIIKINQITGRIEFR